MKTGRRPETNRHFFTIAAVSRKQRTTRKRPRGTGRGFPLRDVSDYSDAIRRGKRRAVNHYIRTCYVRNIVRSMISRRCGNFAETEFRFIGFFLFFPPRPTTPGRFIYYTQTLVRAVTPVYRRPEATIIPYPGRWKKKKEQHTRYVCTKKSC